MKKKQVNKLYRDKLKELEQMKQEALKQIDECPFLSHNKSFLWSLSAFLLGIKDPLSQVDYMKRDVELQFELHKITLMQHLIAMKKSSSI